MLGPAFPALVPHYCVLFYRFSEDPTGVLVFQFFWCPTKVLLGPRIPVFWYAVSYTQILVWAKFIMLNNLMTHFLG